MVLDVTIAKHTKKIPAVEMHFNRSIPSHTFQVLSIFLQVMLYLVAIVRAAVHVLLELNIYLVVSYKYKYI